MGRWHQWFPQTSTWRKGKWKPNREKQSNQQELDQHCQRLEKMWFIKRKLHNDCVIMTESKIKTKLPSKKLRKEETMTLSTAAAPQTRSALQAATGNILKQQQKSSGQELRVGLKCKGQELCDGFSTKTKLLCANSSCQRKKMWMGIRCDWWAVVFCRLPLRVLVLFLVSLAGLSSSRLPLFLCGCCSESENSVYLNLGIQHSISLWAISCFFFQYSESISG